jgi:hypothetical protein
MNAESDLLKSILRATPEQKKQILLALLNDYERQIGKRSSNNSCVHCDFHLSHGDIAEIRARIANLDDSISVEELMAKM